MINDTIVAISTQIGLSAISIIRLSGSKAIEIANKLTKSTSIKPRYAHLKYIYDKNDQILDKCIVIYFKAPNSFNGEDIIEFQCHGGITIPKNIIQECINNGARLAKSGEFSKRALLNNKMDLSMVETIAKMITTQNNQAQRFLTRILNGDLSKYINSFKKELIEILANIEVTIDYAQEDLPQNIEKNIIMKLNNIEIKLDKLYKHSQTFHNIIDGHRLIIIGRPNVGKSSILNKLLLKQRAIISDIAGTTRDIIEESITINNQIVKIIDTAGIHNTSDEIEKIGIQKTKELIKDATIIISVFDASKEFNDYEIINLLKENEDKIIICAINKSDKKIVFDNKYISKYQKINISTTDDSVYLLRDLIETNIKNNEINNQEIILSSTRQIECIKECIKEIKNAKNNLKDFEISAYCINNALKSLDLISNPYNNEEMLDSMFSEFCLGK